MACDEQEYVTIPDTNLAVVVRDALGLDPNDQIPKKKLERLETLSAFQKNIEDLTGLEKAIGLKTLIIRGKHGQQRIRDITPLAKLTQLTELSLSENRITDITPLANLKQLTHLDLSINQVQDITPIVNLKQLTVLRLQDNQIRDFTPLIELIQLTSVTFSNNLIKIQDIANLHRLLKQWETVNRPINKHPVPVKHTKRHTGINFTYEDIDEVSVGYGTGHTTEKNIVGTATVIIVENKNATMYRTVLYGENPTMWKAGTPQLNRSGKLNANSGSIPIDRLNEIKRITVHITVEDEADDGTKRKMETSTEITDFTEGKSAVIIVEDKKDSLITTTLPINDSIKTYIAEVK